VQPLAHVLERPGCAQRGTGKHHRVLLLPEVLFQQGADVQGRGVDAQPGAILLDLRPVDHVFLRVAGERLQLLVHRFQVASGGLHAGEQIVVFQHVEFSQTGQAARQPAHRVRNGLGELAEHIPGLFDVRPLRLLAQFRGDPHLIDVLAGAHRPATLQEAVQRLEIALDVKAHRPHRVGDDLHVGLNLLEVTARHAAARAADHVAEQAAAAVAQVGQLAQQRDLVQLERQAVGRRVFEMVRLVDNQVAVVGQHAVADLDIGQQQRVIDDQDVRRFRVAPCLVERARAVHLVAAPVERAALVLGAQARPDHVLLEPAQRDLALVAAVGLQQPDQDLRQHAQLAHRRRAAAAQRRQPARAQVVAAPLDHCRAAFHAQRLAQDRQVLVDELVLQINRGRADHDALVVLHGPVDGWDQVRQALADPGRRFDHQVLAGVEGVADRPQHLDLLLAVLVTGKVARQLPIRLNRRCQPVDVQRLVIGVGPERLPRLAISLEEVVRGDLLAPGRRRVGAGERGLAAHLQRVEEDGLGRPIQVARGVDDLLQRRQGQLQNAPPQIPIQPPGRHRVIQGAVSVFQLHIKLGHQAGQVVAGRCGHHHRGQLVGI